MIRSWQKKKKKKKTSGTQNGERGRGSQKIACSYRACSKRPEMSINSQERLERKMWLGIVTFFQVRERDILCFLLYVDVSFGNYFVCERLKVLYFGAGQGGVCRSDEQHQALHGLTPVNCFAFP